MPRWSHAKLRQNNTWRLGADTVDVRPSRVEFAKSAAQEEFAELTHRALFFAFVTRGFIASITLRLSASGIASVLICQKSGLQG